MIVIKNAFWLSVCRVAADFASLALFTVISRDLGPASTGEYSYAFALGAFMAILAAAGLDQYGVRQYARLSSVTDRTACWQGMLVAQGIQLVCGIALLTIAVLCLGGQNASPTVIVELSIFLIGWGLSHTFFVPAMADEAMAAPAFIELLCRSAGSLSALALCLLGATSLPLILIGFPIAGVVLVVLSLRNAAQHGARFRLGINWADIRTIARHAAPFTACEALGQFYIRADLLLITYLLGKSSAGWYAADLKMVEVGVMPLILLGTAAYPVLSRAALRDRERFLKLAEEFLRAVLFVSGWLAVGMYSLIPLVIPALFGDRFEPAARLLPMFSLLALTKGLEIALYRLLYATKRQNTYLAALVVGTALIISLTYRLIPQLGTGGAIAAVVLSTAVVDVLAIVNLRSELPHSVFALSLARLMLPLACTALVFLGLRASGLNEWCVAAGACVVFPILGYVCGLIPHPRRSLLVA
jgi:O-antigen/teichoic acid export membrane protein